MPRGIEGRVRRLISPLKTAITKPIRDQAVREAGLTPNGSFDPQDIFVVSYPKSGVNWFRSIISQLVFGVDAVTAPFELQRQIVPDIHRIQYYKRFATPMYFKTHFLPRPEYRRVVYLLRDGRDVLVSYLHFLRARRGHDIQFQDIMGSAPAVPFGAWQEHVEQWDKNPYRADMIVIKYEDLKLDPISALQHLCEFAAISRERAQIESAIEQTEFSRMQDKEKNEGSMAVNWRRDNLFNRRGQIGSHRDEMPEDVRAEFMVQAGETLGKHGYR